VIILSKSDGDNETAQSLFSILSEQFGLRGLQQVNFHSIAKVCQTDAHTTELIIKEIVATMGYLVSRGSSININMKFAMLSIRNGHMNFKVFNDKKENNSNGGGSRDQQDLSS
jgi:hypothetical protein